MHKKCLNTGTHLLKCFDYFDDCMVEWHSDTNQTSQTNCVSKLEEPFPKLLSVLTEVLGVMKASGVISLGITPLLVPEFDRKSVGAGSDGIFLRSVWEPFPDSLSELWSVRWSENPAGYTECEEGLICVPTLQHWTIKKAQSLGKSKQMTE